MNTDQDRRPGLRQMAEAIAKRNPSLSFKAAVAIAKQQYTLRAFDRIKSYITPKEMPSNSNGGAP